MSSELLFVSGEYPPDIGGVGDYTNRLRHGLTALGWPSDVLSRRQVRRWDARALVSLVRVAPPTGIVHIQYQAGAYDLLGDVCLMPAVVRRWRPRARVVTTFHDIRTPYLFPRAGALRQAAVQLLARTSHVTIAADTRDLTALAGPTNQRHHVPIGPNVLCDPPADYERGAFRASLGLDPDTLLVVYFGLRNASKGLDLLVDAFQVLGAQQPRARLLLLGGEVGASDPTDRAITRKLEMRLDARVLRTGWLQPAEVSAYLLAGDVALLPYVDGASARRGTLLACAEHGLPIVSTLPAGREVAAAVLAVQPTADALAAAILNLAHNSAAAAKLRRAGRALAVRAAWPRIAQAHRQIYEQLLYS